MSAVGRVAARADASCCRLSKARCGVAAAVPAARTGERRMGVAQAMDRFPERPALQVRERSMDPASARDGRALQGPTMGSVVVVGQAAITAPAMSVITRAPGAEVPAGRRRPRARRNPRSAAGCGVAWRPRSGDQLDRAGNAHLAFVGCVLARLWPRISLRCGTGGWPHRSPHQVLKRLRSGSTMARRSLCSGRSQALRVTAEPELVAWSCRRGDTVRVAGHDVNGHEPGLQGQVAAVHACLRCMIVTCGHRGLLPAGSAHSQLAVRRLLQRPSPRHGRRRDRRSRRASAWRRAMPGNRRPHREQPARRRRGTCRRSCLSSGWLRRRNITEHPADAHQKLNISSNRA